MKIIQSNSPVQFNVQKYSTFDSSAAVAKLLLTFSMIVTLSACSTFRYNGFSDANTIFDVFSFSEEQEGASNNEAPTSQTEQTAQAKPEIQPLQIEQPDAQTMQQLAENPPVKTPAIEMESTQTEAQSEPEIATQDLNAPEPAAQVAKAEATVQADLSEVTQPQPAQPEATEESVLVSSVTPPLSETEASQEDSAAIAEVNQLTQQNPTAAMVSDYKVLPEVSSEVADLSVPNEILLLAASAEYRPEVSEYGMWKIAIGDDSLYRENCTLASASMQVSFDNYSTQVWLKVVGQDLLVNSTTNIDINKPRVGIRLDNGPLQSFSKKHFNTSAVWSGNLKRALQTNKSLSVALSGNELGGRIQEVTVELDDLKRAYLEYTKCNATTQIGSL